MKSSMKPCSWTHVPGRPLQSSGWPWTDKSGGDSILTLYLAVDQSPDYFASIANPHFFYTPRTTGLSSLLPCSGNSQAEIESWISDYLDLTTYEISCPAMRDPSLAPPVKPA
jgi:hypothetical protein